MMFRKLRNNGQSHEDCLQRGVGFQGRTEVCHRKRRGIQLAGTRRLVQVAMIAGSVLFAGGWGATASAATYYLSPSGSDASSGTSTAAPWKTFKFAIPKLKPGDTLVLRDGTYNHTNSGYPIIYCGKGAVSGTASERITLQAENERKAFLQGNGANYPLQMIQCAYWTVQGLRVEGKDSQSIAVPNGHAVFINQSHHIIFQRNLVRFNNRYKNGNIVSFSGTTDSLIEENEVYSWHRNGTGGGSRNTYRRNYVNSRHHADLPGGLSSGTGSDRGDSGFIFYPSSDNLLENNISEGNHSGFDFQATGTTNNNKSYGNISLSDRFGVMLTARGSGTNLMPHDNRFVDFVAVNYDYVGLNARSAEGTQCQNCSFLGGSSGNNGVAIDAPSSWPGDGYYSFVGTNLLAVNHSGTGVTIASNIDQWAIDAVNSFAGHANFYPASSSNFSNKQSVDPELGACKVFIPEDSPMKGAGENGADIGANVLYRYQNGVLTSQPLWDPSTGGFPCGAIIPGVNDIMGSSCFDVQNRLNVQTNGCSLPSTYSQQSIASATPQNVRIVGAD